MERIDNGPVMFVYPSEILSEYTETTGEKLSPEAHRWAALFDEMASVFDRKGREDRKAGRPAAERECFLAWSVKQFGRQDAGEKGAEVKMENPKTIDLDETQFREMLPVPAIHTGCWAFTMEASLLAGELEKAASSVFAAFPEVVQHALTFTPESGGWADRAKLWQSVLKLALSPRQYYAAMRKILAHYARVVRKRQGTLCQCDLPSEQDFKREVGQDLCEWYRMGAAGEPSPFAEDFEAEARALSAKANTPLEQVLDTPGVRLIYQLGCRAYEDGARLRRQLLERLDKSGNTSISNRYSQKDYHCTHLLCALKMRAVETAPRSIKVTMTTVGSDTSMVMVEPPPFYHDTRMEGASQ